MTNSSLSAELVAFAADKSGSAKVELVGDSMRPLMRSGMLVEVEPLTATPRIGDVLVFRTPGGLVAHRFVRVLGPAGFLMYGDAFPEKPEPIGRSDVVGRVRSVWSKSGRNVRRIDGPFFHAAGRIMVWTRSSRAILRLLLPWFGYAFSTNAGVPAVRAMIGASISFERGQFRTGILRAQAVPLDDLLAAAIHHGMGGLFLVWLKAATDAGEVVPPSLVGAFQKLRWFTALTTEQVIQRARDVSSCLSARGIDGILLKGAARLTRGEAGADLVWAGDVDVLVPEDRAEEAVAALKSVGYTDRATAAEAAFYRKREHHRAPLWPPSGTVPVEVHVTLSRPGSVSARLDYATLAAYAETVEISAGAVRVFDDIASALHLAYHVRDFHRWRDIVLLSRYLRRMSVKQRAEFDRLAARERRDTIRLQSAIAAGDGLSGDFNASPSVAAYISWAIARESLPLALRKRSSIVEASLARSYMYYRGFGHMASQVHRWLYNILATPIVLRWAFRDSSAYGGGSELFNVISVP